MGFFKKKSDPLAQRAQSLNRRIAELEAEIARLNQNLDAPAPGRPHPTPPPTATAPSHPGSTTAPAPNPGHPSGPATPTPHSRASHEPVFERMPPRSLEPRAPEPPAEGAVQLGLKRPLWSQWLGRLKRQLVDPPPTNEKLVNYLAAGGIQGLRPLRYERRIARNRIIFICVVLGLVLWGLMVVFWQSR